MNYKTTFKKSKFKIYKIKNSFKCVACCVLNGIDPKDTTLVRKLTKKFKDIKITEEGVLFEVFAFSKCHSSDEFNEQKGRMLAESRCKKRVFDKVSKILQYVVEIKKNELTKLRKSQEKYEVMSEDEFDHLMQIDGKSIYQVSEIYREEAEGVISSDLILANMETGDSETVNISDDIIARARIAKGDYIYLNKDNTNEVFQATSRSLNKRLDKLNK